MASQVMFLEAYIESTNTLPTELQRLLNTIRALDEKCLALSGDLQGNVGALLTMPPAWAQPQPQPEYTQLSERVAQDQKMLLQFGDEKTQLAQQALDLLEVHALELERVIDDLEKELNRSNDWELTAAADFGLETQRGKTPKPADEFSVLAGEAPAPAAVPLPPIPSQKRSVAAAGTSLTKASKRPREESDAVGGLPQTQSKKKASTLTTQVTLHSRGTCQTVCCLGTITCTARPLLLHARGTLLHATLCGQLRQHVQLHTRLATVL